jgi:hypothetical protein
VNVKQSVLDEKIQDGAISSSAIGFQKKRKRATAPVARQVAVFNDYNTYEFAGLKIQISGILDPKFDGKGLYQLVEVSIRSDMVADGDHCKAFKHFWRQGGVDAGAP